MTQGTITADWIAVDWGTSTLRAWAVAEDGRILAEARSDRGMGGLDRDGFEPALLELVAPWLGQGPTRVLACGMVGSRQGWAEVPYAAAPCRPEALTPVPVAARDPRLAVAILPGIRQDRPLDVMRGEETQIAGFLAAVPAFDGVLCLPGSHTKWAEISAGEIVGFRSAMTGEIFAALASATVLRHSVGPGWDDTAFAEAVSDGLSRPEMLAARLFSIRAEGLLAGLSPAAATARLSGLLIGAELAAMRPFWLGRDIALIGAPDLCGRYAAALSLQGVAPRQAEGGAMVLAGLAACQRAQG